MKRISYLVAGFVSLAMPASAATVDAVDILRSFSVVALGDYTLRSDQPAPAFVGGDFTSVGSHSINVNGNFPNGTVGGVSGGLIVGGSVLPGGNNNVRGDVVIGSNQTVTQPNPNQRRFNVGGKTFETLNQGTTVTSGAAVPVAEVATAFQTLSTNLSQTANTSAITFAGDSNNPRLTFANAIDGIAIINLTQAELAQFVGRNRNAQFNLGTNNTVVLNVAGTTFATNGGNLNLNGGNSNVIFNFFEATSITLNNTFGASILAPLADVFANSGGSNVFLVGNNVTQRIEIRSPFTGNLPSFAPAVDQIPSPVPLPAAAFLLLAGLGGLGALRATRRA